MAADQYVIRACCHGAPPGHGTVERIDDPDCGKFAFSDNPGPIVADLAAAPEINRRICLHEAGHAVVLHVLGVGLKEVRVTPPARAEAAGKAHLSRAARIAISYAGPLAEGLDARYYATTDSASNAEYFARVSHCEFGTCDRCSMAMHALTAAGHDREAAQLFQWRAESKLIELFATHPMRGAVLRLADSLAEQHVIDGATTHAIIAESVEFGAHSDFFSKDTSHDPSNQSLIERRRDFSGRPAGCAAGD